MLPEWLRGIGLEILFDFLMNCVWALLGFA